MGDNLDNKVNESWAERVNDKILDLYFNPHMYGAFAAMFVGFTIYTEKPRFLLFATLNVGVAIACHYRNKVFDRYGNVKKDQ